ncbi:cobalamin biosynthesis protein CbiD [Geobacter metallireducens RCH3]|uniref:Cobalt-precorrin-5B C(1)-methyltransferase n=1 Tax=Geobacter metallireducens (strain ATCC 53774 / DSM 7210 / GS-15) TaxID=269799 RepID=CBID_GEOMG|nr:cobalt-precorrin-5B (C(1))-methyltransferase [Geobacter metallireducens]Q39YF3.1 RecName: Full=Cobalt-precorrin-5B C(1)-methyltransferase; AltName: Full=Cobalt-precorrin-6A synthase [Geobacter metallireducens GS-15]ABB30721.1 cobalt-precorrin-5B C1-methyltransferase [Geobacter metallireducens GS-15]EHP85528.1 cobalamin biosynthesis protein CbiD [Geobacter metallireducens RCH3]
MNTKPLRHGYTTGACAAAAAKGAARMLREQRPVEEVELVLPKGERVAFRLHGQEFDDSAASCFVVKDAGDDPDVTNGAEIHARVRREPLNRSGARTMVFVDGGKGVGTVTKPGLGVGVGNPAINPVPMRMITEGVKEEFSVVCLPQVLHVTISIPNGEELAKKTLNARLGIVGGLSILGTTGIVRPISAKAWTDTLDAALDVARACGCETIVLSTGRTSELVAIHAGIGDRGPGTGKTLPEEAYVMMGDHVGYALRACARKGVRHVILVGQFAKLLKIACGHEQTHVSSSELDLQMLAEWLHELGSRSPVPGPWSRYNTARQVLEESGNDSLFMELVCTRARDAARRLAPSLDIKVLLAGYDSTVLYFG